MNESIKYWPELICKISAMLSHVRKYKIEDTSEGCIMGPLSPSDVENEIWRALKRFAKENGLCDITTAIEKLKWEDEQRYGIGEFETCEECGETRFCLPSKDDGKQRCQDCEREHLFGKTIIDPFLSEHI